VLEGLFERGANVVGVITLPPADAAGTSDYVDLHPMCAERGVPVVDTSDVNEAESLDRIRRLSPDYVFTLGWSQLFGRELLGLPKEFVVGSHPSPLPLGRGRAPVPWTILENEARSAVTLFRMDQGADSGDILRQRWFDVPGRVYAMELYGIVAENLREAFCDLYEALRRGPIEGQKQDASAGSLRAKRTPADGLIDFTASATMVERLVRAVSRPYPGAYTYYEGKKVEIWKASIQDVPVAKGAPGQVITRRKGRLLVQAGGGPVWLWDLTREGHELPWRTIALGSRFGYRVEDELHSLRQEVAALREAVAELGRTK